jgi:1-phosphofructokinase family hexose kinase
MILAAGLSPAWQQVLVFDAFTPGAVNRARQVHWCASGKVLNAARALRLLGADARALTLAGGTVGGALRRDVERSGIAARWVEMAAPTRVCTTILDTASRTATELVPEAPPIMPDELAEFRSAYREEAARAAVVVLIGSLPAGTPGDWYRDLIGLTPGRVVVDARGPELLEAAAARPFLVKPNRDELRRTLGRELHGEGDLHDAMRELNRRGAAWVVVTAGGEPVHATTLEQCYRFVPPPVAVVNPIGCGDCMAAAIAHALHEGREPVDAIRRGVAVAADKVGRTLPGEVDPAAVEELERRVAMQRC